jgi:hypothetical protein
MRSRIAIVASLLALLVVVLFNALPYRQHSSGTEHVATPPTAPGARQGFPPPLTDLRPPVVATTRTVELCGYGQITVDPQDHPYPEQVRAAAKDALVRMTDALAADADPGRRATAAYLAATTKAARAAEAVRGGLPPNCGESPDCMQRLFDASSAPLRRDADQLAATVSTGRDGRAYATALLLCDRAYVSGRSSGHCARLSVAQWTALEPDNVIAWLSAASRAQAAGDRTAQDAALRGAARATSSRLDWQEPLALADHAEIAKLPPPVRLAVLTDLLGTYSAVPLPPLLAASQHCGKGVAMDDTRRRECSAIAEALLTGSSLLELSLGIAFGRQAGWPDDKLAPLQDKLDAIQQATSHPLWDSSDYWSCGFLETLQGYATRLARQGEVGVGEEAIKQTGKSPSEVASQWRERMIAQRKRHEESRR